MITRFLKTITITDPSGKALRVEAFKVSRSERSEIWDILFKFNKRWITKLEIRIREYDLGKEYPILVLHALYSGSPLQWLTYKDNPLFKLIPKENNEGQYFSVPVRYGV